MKPIRCAKWFLHIYICFSSIHKKEWSPLDCDDWMLCVSYLSFFDHYKILEDFFIIDKKENRVHSTFDCDNWITVSYLYIFEFIMFELRRSNPMLNIFLSYHYSLPKRRTLLSSQSHGSTTPRCHWLIWERGSWRPPRGERRMTSVHLCLMVLHSQQTGYLTWLKNSWQFICLIDELHFSECYRIF